MKYEFSVFKHPCSALSIFWFVAMLSLTLATGSVVESETKTGDELISLSVNDETLGSVLKKISTVSGYEISLDDKWQNHLVTVSLVEVSLHKGLKRILANLDNVIIYGSGRKIKIIIFGKTSHESISSSTDKLFPSKPSYQLPATQNFEKEDSSGAEKDNSDNFDVPERKAEASDIEREEETNLKKPLKESVEGEDADSENKSPE